LYKLKINNNHGTFFLIAR